MFLIQQTKQTVKNQGYLQKKVKKKPNKSIYKKDSLIKKTLK